MELLVFVGERRVGVLGHEAATNRFSFAYDAAWLADPTSFALSPDLPLDPEPGQSEEVTSRCVRNFFENLLPEGQALEDAAYAHRTSSTNAVGLLAALGRETAGSLRILRDEGQATAPPHRRELLASDLSERIQNRALQPFSVWDGKVRLSIAGYQDKVAVMVEQGRWFLVEGADLASTHILKPPPARASFATLPYNEFVCMRLAAFIKLPVARVALVHVPEPVLVVERFDRKRVADRIERLHLVDGCQALGLPVGHKYERPYGNSLDVAHERVGASLPALFRLADTFPQPLAARVALLRWVIFQVLVGNTDAHAKNLSFYCGPKGLSLAPAYDIVCALAYGEQFDQTLALAIGDAFTYPELSAFEWANFAERCGLQPKLVARELRALSTNLVRCLGDALTQARDLGAPPELLKDMRTIIEEQCRRHQALALHIPKAFAELL